jgi:hypothetical protein
MKEKEKWDKLLEMVMVICRVLLNTTSSAPHTGSAQIRILAAMFCKGFDTLRAIQLLYNADLPIQAQALIRILFEIRVDTEIFLRLCAKDPVEAGGRVLDAMMLQKISQQRQSNFVGHDLVSGAPTPEELLQAEKILIEKHGKDIAQKLRRNGFSGLSIEDRAKQVGLSGLYNIVYRNFSRNVHNTDYMEHLALQGVGKPERWNQYRDIRDHIALSTAISCVWRLHGLSIAYLGVN